MTNAEGPPIWKPPPKIHWNDVVSIQKDIMALSKYEDTYKYDGELGCWCGTRGFHNVYGQTLENSSARG